MSNDIIDHSTLTPDEERAMHALTHCEDEQACTFCNPSSPAEYQVDGPRSCGKYYEACACTLCAKRDNWYITSAT
jgi:hypothetical protein